MKYWLAILAIVSSGCSKNGLLDVAMGGAIQPASSRGMRVGDRQIVSGDLHCHVLPPDHPSHVSRTVAETLALAEKEGLDFIVLTPHVHSRFFADPEERVWVKETQAILRATLAASRPSMVVVPGFEYTDYEWGHAGFAFADLDTVLAEAPIDAPLERFFERWIANGGVITINHPVLRPTPGSVFSPLRWDLSWRAFSQPVPEDVRWLTNHAQTIETYNVGVSWLRDHVLLGDPDRALREATHIADAIGRTRRIAPVGGTDSHGEWLRSTTWVLARERSIPSIRDAILESRTCVRGPEACTLEVRSLFSPDGEESTSLARRISTDGPWHGVGDAMEKSSAIEARASGNLTLIANGAIVAHAAPREIARTTLPDGCVVLRAIVDDSWSAPVWIGCGS